jgi:hypothetical protein
VIGKREVPQTDTELKEYMKRRCPFNHMTVMFKRSDVLQAGNYQDWFWNEDYYLWIRMALAGMEFQNLPETLFMFVLVQICTHGAVAISILRAKLEFRNICLITR